MVTNNIQLLYDPLPSSTRVSDPILVAVHIMSGINAPERQELYVLEDDEKP